MSKNNNNRTLLEKLRYKYRLIVINEDTFEQKASVRLSRFNLYAGVSILAVLLIMITTGIIAYTPLKYYMPGVGNIDIRSKLANLEFEADSLTEELNHRNYWISNFQKIVSGDLDSAFFQKDSAARINITEINLNQLTDQEKKLREEMEAEEQATIADVVDMQNNVTNDGGLGMMPALLAPVQGYITESFSANEHFGVDIAGEADEPVLATLDGTVIIADWNPETGHVIAIQHSDNLISFYKHNAVILKKVGNFVAQGEAIAIIGNSGELSTGPHLHFELWSNGKVLNPTDYLSLENLN